MDIGLEADLRRQLSDLKTKISEYERLLYHHEPGWNSLKQAEAQARESKAFLAAIVESFDGLIYVVSQDLKIQYQNKIILQKFGSGIGEYCF